MSILSEAGNIVDGDRQQTYGTPLENHTRTAQLWSAYLGFNVTPRDVCMMNILQKASRDRFKPHRDNLIDIAGYAENAQRCEPCDPAADFLKPLIGSVFDSAAKCFAQKPKTTRCPATIDTENGDNIVETRLQCALDAGHADRHNSNTGFRWD